MVTCLLLAVALAGPHEDIRVKCQFSNGTRLSVVSLFRNGLVVVRTSDIDFEIRARFRLTKQELEEVERLLLPLCIIGFPDTIGQAAFDEARMSIFIAEPNREPRQVRLNGQFDGAEKEKDVFMAVWNSLKRLGRKHLADAVLE